jgi:flagellar hook assembly protein FlgD
VKECEIQIHDVLGRRVRTLRWALHGEPEVHVLWDGTADDGLPVPAGVYYAVLQHRLERQQLRIAVVR